ncbi:carbohydrate kinase family protein [Clostridium isatidis]|uniref:carbohydrate kinase family protein n=1 Tax=Clostridium isatidis TaxID=182773 RepID=UPI0017E1C9F8|nr:kinase [Clostridiales bacterium]
MCNNSPYILVLGASIVDIIGFSKKPYHGRDSIPGSIKISLGGVCRNIAENLARVNVKTEFISIIGGDSNGKQILENSREIGYSMEHSLILKEECTPTYMAILNEEGEMEAAIVDMESLNKMETSFIASKAAIIENAEYIIVDADNPKLLEYLLINFSHKTRFILDPVSATKAEKIKHLIKYFHTIKPNRIETEALCGFKIESYKDLKKAADFFLSLGVKNVFISLDSEGIYYKTSTEEGKIGIEAVKVKNVTGAGDAFVAGVGYGYMNNLSIRDTVKHAIAMSIITITNENTINPNMSEEYVKEAIEKINWIEE